VEVRPVRGHHEMSSFVGPPWQLYRGVSQWVPPLLSERKRHPDRRRNPFSEEAVA
jgi:hypothetical protein